MNVTKLVVHHSASPRDTTTVADVSRWHRERGFSQIGYHQLILSNGTVQAGRPESIMGAHALGANQNSLGVCLMGNFENETPTAAQISSLVSVLQRWTREHRLPTTSIYGHFDVPGGKTATACPGRNLKSQMQNVKLQVGQNAPKFTLETKVQDPNLRRALRKALDDDARLSFSEVQDLILAISNDNSISRQELVDLQAILENSRSMDHRSRQLVENFLTVNPTPTPAPTPTLGEGQLTANFRLSEFGCRDGTPVPSSMRSNVQELANNLQELRGTIGKAIHINSGYRTPTYNKRVGGVSNSQHLYAKAADIRVSGMSPSQVHSQILSMIGDGKMKQGGLGLYNSFVHYDIRGTAARW
ncbi:MAG: D-Ala-D-Ala carboxypeptidase family metallohydrolase [Planctomycetota bacterium]